MTTVVITMKNQKNLYRLNIFDHPIVFSKPLLIDLVSTWVEHVPFGMLIVDLLRPEILVELGTFSGTSYSAFCQSVQTLGLKTRCFSVDTWEGDEHGGFFTPQVYEDLLGFNNSHYDTFSSLLKMTFDDALNYFADGSIDLLHIDGFHSYEAVKHDFEAWLPKMSPKGVVLIHDICEIQKDFGVWRLWRELKIIYPNFEFTHEHGLCIIRR